MRLGAARQQSHQRTVVGLAGLWQEAERVGALSSLGLFFHHLKVAFRGVRLAPLGTLMTLLSTAIALSLFGVFLLFFQNAWGLLSAQNAAFSLSVFLEPSLAREEIEKLQVEISGRAGVERVAIVTPELALERFRETLGEHAGVLEGVENDNPLPPSLEITFVPADQGDMERIASSLADSLSERPGVSTVLFDRGLVAQLSALARSFISIGLVGVVLLFVMIGFVITSTTRLAVHAHRDEIQIMRLVGARHEYVRAPFLIDGAFQGALGGALGVGLLYGIFAAVRRGIEHAEVSQGFFPELAFLPWWGCVLMAFVGLGLGLGASWITLRRLSIDV